MLTVELKKLLEKGVGADVWHAEEGYAVYVELANYANQINGSDSKFSRILKYLQNKSQNDIIMAICRVFDAPSNRYPTRCFLGLVDYLEKNSGRLPRILNHKYLFEAMKDAGFVEAKLFQLREAKDQEITEEIVAFFREKIKNKRTQLILGKAKNIRDKQLAHNEDLAKIDAPTWDELLSLVELAQKLIGIVGWAYLNTGYFLNGKYLLSDDARSISLDVRQLIEEVT